MFDFRPFVIKSGNESKFFLGTRTNPDGSRWIVPAVAYNNHLRKEGVDEEVGRV